MNLGVILPHTKLYGGVKRFLELGNIFIEMGHRFTVYTIEGLPPTWYNFKGEVKTFEALTTNDIDVLFTTEVKFIDQLLGANAKHRVIYHVRMTEKMRPFIKSGKVEVFACSSNIFDNDKRKYGIEPFPAFGGINTANYTPKTSYEVKDRPFIVLAYGRLVERVKGTKYVVKACERLYKKGYNIKLLLFDTATSEKHKAKIDAFTTTVPYEFIQNHPFERNSELFNRADLFVAAEAPHHAGWSNTVCEAMACALPVVATVAGTKDFLIDEVTGLRTQRYTFLYTRKIRRMIEDEALRQRLGQAARKQVEKFDWHLLAAKIIAHFEAKK